MKATHLISIVLPVYNGEKFLAETINSCLSQTYTNFELIIVDDGSIDKSLFIARKYQDTDQRIRIIENKTNRKLPYTLNNGLTAAVGEFVTWTSDDNILAPTFLEVLLCELLKTESDFVYSDYLFIDKSGKLLRKQSVGSLLELPFQNVIGPSFLGKAKVFKQARYDEDLFKIEDYAFWLTNLLSYKCIKCGEPLYRYRLHGSSLTSQISTTGGFKYDLVDRMFSTFIEKCDWSTVSKEVLVWNQIDKKKAALFLLENRETVVQEVFTYCKSYLNQVATDVFRSHVNHYQKLMDLLPFDKAMILGFKIIGVYPLSVYSLKWFLIYSLKRIKRALKGK